MYCYFLIWRVRRTAAFCAVGSIDWTRPTGGLVMTPRRVFESPSTGKKIAVADWPLVRDLAELRYHQAPGEELVIAEVFCEHERRTAEALCDEWEAEMREFLELMGANR